MLKTEDKRNRAKDKLVKDKLVSDDELRRVQDAEGQRGVDAGENEAILDYVMRDFGLPEEEDRDNGLRT